MNTEGKKVLKAGTWYTISTFILKGLAFLTTPIFARLMSEEALGNYANYIAWVTILTSVVTLDLFTSVNLAHFEYDGSIYPYLSTISIFGSICSTVFYGIALIFKEQVMGWLGISEYMLHVMFIYFIVSPALSALHAKFRIYLQYKHTLLTSLIPAILSVLVAVLLVVTAPDDDKLSARVTGYYGVWILASLAVFVFVVAKGRSFKREYIRFALPIALPMVLHTLSNALLSLCDRVMIKNFCGDKDTAYYSIAYSCAMIISVLWQSVNQAWAPWVYERMHKEETEQVTKVVRPIILLFSGGVLLVILMAPELLLLMGGEKYAVAVDVVPPVMLGYIAQMLYTLYVNVEYFYKKQKQIMLGTMIAAVLNIILNWIFIPIFGYVAAAYTTLAGYIALLLIHYLFVRKMGRQGMYDMRFNLIVLAGSMVFGIAMTLLYKVDVVRFIIIGLAFGFLIFFLARHRRELAKCLKKKDIVGVLKVCRLMSEDKPNEEVKREGIGSEENNTKEIKSEDNKSE